MDGRSSAPVKLFRVNAAEATEFAAYCREVYRQHYEYLWLPGGSSWYQAQVFDAASIQLELAGSDVEHLLVEFNEQRCGFVRLVLASDVEGEAGGLELSRIYLDSMFKSQGLGRQIIELVAARARSLGRRYIWLHVMESARSAIAFYEALGFKTIGNTQLPYPLMKAKYRVMLKMRLWL
jgi:diamine N-acetyltransferase